jgi:hypothetical protein
VFGRKGEQKDLPPTRKAQKRSDSLACLFRAVAGRFSEATGQRVRREQKEETETRVLGAAAAAAAAAASCCVGPRVPSPPREKGED